MSVMKQLIHTELDSFGDTKEALSSKLLAAVPNCMTSPSVVRETRSEQPRLPTEESSSL